MEEHKEISVYSAFCLIINSIIGAGVLSIPWAYSQGGLLLGILSQITASIFSAILSYQLLQTMSRVSQIRELTSKGFKITPVPFSKLFQKTDPKDFISHDSDIDPLIETSKITITTNKSDMTSMTLILLGENHARFNCILFSLGTIVILIAYASIFATSLISIIPIFGSSTCNIYEDDGSFGDSCWRKYWFYLLILLTFASVLSLMQLREQAWFQGTLAAMRFFVGILIVITSFIVIVSNKNLDDDDNNKAKLVLFDFNGAGVAFSIILLANYYQPFIPNAVQWMANKEINGPLAINWAVGIVSILYLLLGIVVSMAVYDVEEMVTLEWVDYTGGKSEQKWWAYLILYLIILFPAFDILSIFPLVVITLSDNIMSLFDISESEEHIVSNKFIFFRISSVLLPILLAAIIYNLGFLNNITGLFSILTVGIYLPSLALASKKIIPQKTEYDSYFSSEIYSILMLIAHLLIFILCLVMIIFFYKD